MSLSIARNPSRPVAATELPLSRWLATATAAGVLLSLLLPSYSYWLGWTPLWLVLMPAASWWALHGFRVPSVVKALTARRRCAPVQARRRRKSLNKRVIVRVA